MPFDPNTSTWKYEDDSVEGKVKGLVDTNSPLIQQARTQATQAANRRGLIDSSISVGMGQEAAYKAALPIAQQDATQLANKNQEIIQQPGREKLQTMQTEGTKDVARINTSSSEKIAGMQSETQKEIARLENEAAAGRLQTQIAGQAAEGAANRAAQEKIALAEQAAQKERLGMQLSSTEALALRDQLAQKERLGQQLTSQEKQTLDRINADKEISGAQNDATRKGQIATAVANARSTYTSLVNTITNNTNIPASARGAYLVNAAKAFESDVKTISALYNVPITFLIPDFSNVAEGGDPTMPQVTIGQ